MATPKKAKMSSKFGRLVSALRNLRGNPKNLVGSDLSGNMYYERMTRSEWMGHWKKFAFSIIIDL